MSGRCPTCGTELAGKDKHPHQASHDWKRILAQPAHQEAIAHLIQAVDNRQPLSGEEIAEMQTAEWKTKNGG